MQGICKGIAIIFQFLLW